MKTKPPEATGVTRRKRLAVEPLLALLRQIESAGDYDAVFHGSKIKPPKPLTRMRLNDVLDWQKQSVDAGSFSSASGAYQFIRATLSATIRELGVDPARKWSPALQDEMAIHLLEGRGLTRFLRSEITTDDFMMQLSREWAAIPRPDTGRSYYDDDGVNSAQVSVDEAKEVLSGVRRTYRSELPPEPKARRGPAAAAGAAGVAALGAMASSGGLVAGAGEVWAGGLLVALVAGLVALFFWRVS